MLPKHLILKIVRIIFIIVVMSPINAHSVTKMGEFTYYYSDESRNFPDNGGFIGVTSVDATYREPGPPPFDVGQMLIKAIDPSGGAYRAGIRIGDVIITVNNALFESRDAMLRAIRSHAPGTAIQLQIIRPSATQKIRTVTVVTGPLSSNPQVSNPRDYPPDRNQQQSKQGNSVNNFAGVLAAGVAYCILHDCDYGVPSTVYPDKSPSEVADLRRKWDSCNNEAIFHHWSSSVCGPRP